MKNLGYELSPAFYMVAYREGAYVVRCSEHGGIQPATALPNVNVTALRSRADIFVRQWQSDPFTRGRFLGSDALAILKEMTQ